MTKDWIKVEDQPLYKIGDGRTIVTDDGDREFMAAVPTNKGWWIRHCVIDDGLLCVVGDIDNEVAGWELEDVTHWLPIPQAPVDWMPNP